MKGFLIIRQNNDIFNLFYCFFTLWTFWILPAFKIFSQHFNSNCRDEDREREEADKEIRRQQRQELEYKRQLEKEAMPKKQVQKRTEWEVEFIKVIYDLICFLSMSISS